jgi:hypothetical protein
MPKFYEREEVSREQVRKYIKPFIFHKESMSNFWKSLVYLTLGKAFGMTSPFILKYVVNAMMSLSSTPAAAAGAGVAMTATVRSLSLTTAIGCVGLWGFTKLVSSTLMCYQMNSITSLI